MAARSLLLLLIVLLSSNYGLAIKGQRSRRSLLEESSGSLPKVTEETVPKDKAVLDKEGEEKGEKKGDKKGDKKDKEVKKEKNGKKEGKKGKKGKKEGECKKRKNGGKKSSSSESSSDEDDEDNSGKNSRILATSEENDSETTVENIVPASDETPKEELPWCDDLSVQAQPDCSMLQEGVFPEENTAGGVLELEMSPKGSGSIKKLERILQSETSLSAVGCEGRRLLENETMANVTIYLLGFQIGNSTETKKKCNSTEQVAEDCTVVKTPVVIHYAGDATEEQLQAMFDTLSNTVWAQVERGELDNVGSVYSAEANIVDSEGDNSYNKGSGNSGGMIGGIVVAVAVIALAIAGYVYMKKRNAGIGSSAAVAPTDQTPGVKDASDVEGARSHVFG